jgi:ABC-type branched-subunit amino acid transport system permease subunit
MYMMIGGEDKFIGPIIGTVIFVLIPEVARGLSSYAPYITGICTLLVAYLLPGGLAGIPDLVRQHMSKNKASAISEGGDK